MQPVIPIEPYASDPAQLLALCIWREARGESYAAMLGVVWVIRNRCAMAPAQGFKPTVTENILKPYAFSSFCPDDPNSQKYPEPGSAWNNCLTAAMSAESDPTMGAVFYYSRPLTEPPQAWGSVEHSADIGGLHFCRIAAAAIS